MAAGPASYSTPVACSYSNESRACQCEPVWLGHSYVGTSSGIGPSAISQASTVAFVVTGVNGERGAVGLEETSAGSPVVVLLAGGAGRRLWPLSRPGRAKQFAPLLGDTTAAFDRCTATCLDRGLLERVRATSTVQHRFVRADLAWDDVGSYSALARHFSVDAAGNASRGHTLLQDVTGSLVIAGAGLRVRVVGSHDLVVCAEAVERSGGPGVCTCLSPTVGPRLALDNWGLIPSW